MVEYTAHACGYDDIRYLSKDDAIEQAVNNIRERYEKTVKEIGIKRDKLINDNANLVEVIFELKNPKVITVKEPTIDDIKKLSIIGLIKWKLKNK